MVSRIGDVMTRSVITLHKGANTMDAVKLMAEHAISCIIIIDNSYRPIGIVTERDMVKRVLKNTLDPRSTRIEDVMTSPVITMPGDRKITEAINIMHKYHFRRIVVVTGKNRLLGILTQSDLLMRIHKVQLELEDMNENLRNTIKSLKRYKKATTAEARIDSLKKKIRGLERTLERAHRDVSNPPKKR
jgi:CBS domain-containing protein